MKLPRGLARRFRTMLIGLLLTSGFAVRAKASRDVDEDDNNFREDVIVCEEAVAHATACCGFAVQGDACRYYDYHANDSCGCSGGDDGDDRKQVRPVVSPAEGHRIADLSCSAMNAVGADGMTECARIHVVLEKDNENESHTTKKCL